MSGFHREYTLPHVFSLKDAQSVSALSMLDGANQWFTIQPRPSTGDQLEEAFRRCYYITKRCMSASRRNWCKPLKFSAGAFCREAGRHAEPSLSMALGADASPQMASNNLSPADPSVAGPSEFMARRERGSTAPDITSRFNRRRGESRAACLFDLRDE